MSTTHSNNCLRTNDISTVTIKDRSPWKNHSLWWCCIYAVELKEKKRLLTLSLTVEFALMLASWANFLPYFNPSWSAIYLKKKIHGVKMLHAKFIKHYFIKHRQAQANIWHRQNNICAQAHHSQFLNISL